MLFLLGYVYLSLVQWMRQYRRHKMYKEAIRQVTRRSSILIQRTGAVQDGSLGLLMQSRLLNCSTSYKERRVLEDVFLTISAVEPKQRVLLKSWTSYLDLHPSYVDPAASVMVLLEAERPQNLQHFLEENQRIPPACRVHVLQHGCPIAWKPGNHFGIILHCSLEDFVVLSDAFGQGRLTMGEELQLDRILTVKTEGRPHSLLENNERAVELEDKNVEEPSPQGTPLRLSQKPRPSPRRREEDLLHRKNLSPLRSFQPPARQLQFISPAGGDGPGLVRTEQQTPQLGLSGTGDSAAKGIPNGVDNGYAFLETEEAAQFPLVTGSKQTKDTNDDQVNSGSGGFSENSVLDTPNRWSTVAVNGIASVNGCQDESMTNGNSELITQSDHSLLNNHKDGSVPGGTKSAPSALLESEASSDRSMKPPNVLIYCGKKDSVRKFEEVRATLELCLNTDCYSLYHLKQDMVETTPWADNTTLVVVAADSVYGDALAAFEKYVSSGGKLLCFTCNLEDHFLERQEVRSSVSIAQISLPGWNGLSVMRGHHRYTESDSKLKGTVLEVIARDDKTSEALVVLLKEDGSQGQAVAVFSQVYLDKDPTDMAINPEMFSRLKNSNPARLEVVRYLLGRLGLDASPQSLPDLTPALLLAATQEKKSALLRSLHRRLTDLNVLKSRDVNLVLLEGQSGVMSVSQNSLPLITGSDPPRPLYFIPEQYWENLQTRVLGQVVVYVDVVPTTMPLLDGMMFSLPEDVGVVAIAGRQTAGRGRGVNSWLSPPGCAMFSLHVRISTHSELGSRVSLLQHIAALAVVQSVRSLPGYQDINLRLKWPNDIYYGKDMKLGGVIVTSTVMADLVHAIVGCGFNVSNSNPTICINDVITLHNRQFGTSLAPLTTSQLIGRTVSLMESLIDQVQAGGSQDLFRFYYTYWLHQEAVVELQQEDGTREKVRVRGLDSYGFLEVETSSGQTLVLQPDGNSFDMMRNLITAKRS